MENHSRITKEIISDVEIIFVDLERTSEAEYFEVTEMVTKMSTESRDVQYFFAINVYKCPVSMKIIEAAKHQVIYNFGYSSITALYGMNPLRRTIMKMINSTSKKKLNLFDLKNEAIDFLLETASKAKLELYKS